MFVEKMAEQWYGYGRWDAPFWFLGPQPGGDNPNGAAAAWEQLGREELLDMVWGRDVYVEPRTVDVHIRRLRKAINADVETDLIRTVRAAGYALDLAE